MHLAEVTFVASPAFASATLAVSPASLLAVLGSPEAAVVTRAIHLDPSVATASSFHPVTTTLRSAPAASVMEE